MNVDNFAEWLRRQGHQVIWSESGAWYNAGPRVLQAFPYGEVIQPSEAELRRLMLGRGIAALRYSTPLSAPQGMVSYHVILNGPYLLEDLTHQSRTNIQRGLCSCHVEPIPLTRLAEEGWLLQYDTLKRQGRLRSMSQEQWQRICLSAQGLPGFEAWGAMVDGELAASLLTVRVGDTFYVPYAQSLHKFMDRHVNHALFFVSASAMISSSGIRRVFYSLHSLDAPESVNAFKFRMGFSALPVRQRVVFHPFLVPFANETSLQVLQKLVKRYPESHIVSKTEGMLHFYMSGRHPLENQEWPTCLQGWKERYLQSAANPDHLQKWPADVLAKE